MSMFFYAFPGETLGSNPYRYLVGPALQPAEQPQSTHNGRPFQDASTNVDSGDQVHGQEKAPGPFQAGGVGAGSVLSGTGSDQGYSHGDTYQEHDYAYGDPT